MLFTLHIHVARKIGANLISFQICSFQLLKTMIQIQFDHLNKKSGFFIQKAKLAILSFKNIQNLLHYFNFSSSLLLVVNLKP